MKRNIIFLLNIFADFLQKKQYIIRYIQWIIVFFYLLLLIIPVFIKLPTKSSHIIDNFFLFSQFIFWGIWWPFVILSMICFGRLWCGIFCPEGWLSEWISSKKGLNKNIPKIIKWNGLPVVTFLLTTLYGQLISVYDYACATLIILGGSTIASMIVGFIFGKGTRVWCRYICPVSGVFNLLSRLSPISFKTNKYKWENYKNKKVSNPNCPAMVNIKQLQGVSSCHMCGRCNNYRNSVSLEIRSCNEEILLYKRKNNKWEIYLLFYGIIGVSVGAFTWATNPFFVYIKLKIAHFLIKNNIFWPLNNTAPWWLLTNYPDNNDQFNWLDGFCISLYIISIGFLFGIFLHYIVKIIVFIIGKDKKINYHISQSFIPIGAANLFLGLTETTFKLLKNNGIIFHNLNNIRWSILGLSTLWTIYLGSNIICKYEKNNLRLIITVLLIFIALIPIIVVWVIKFL